MDGLIGCDGPRDLAALVVAAQGGDRAFESLVRATHAETYTLAFRLTGDDEDARDVTQDTYLRAYRALTGSGATPASRPGCTGSPPTAPAPSSANGPGTVTTS